MRIVPASDRHDGGSLVDRAVGAVRAHIRDRNLKVGDTLPGEGGFATDLGVSRAVIREAFGALAALGLLDVGNGRKARVGAIDGSVMAATIDHAVATAQISTRQVGEVRRALETRAAELAAEHRSDADARDIVVHAAAMASATNDPDALTRHDIAFHQAIARASGNPLLRQIVRSLESQMRAVIPAAWTAVAATPRRSAMLMIHVALAEAIVARDPVGARAAMIAHFDAASPEAAAP